MDTKTALTQIDDLLGLPRASPRTGVKTQLLLRGSAAIRRFAPVDHIYQHLVNAALSPGKEDEAAIVALLEALRTDLAKGYIDDANDNPRLQRVERICSRFHRVAKRLGECRKGKTPFVISDEYDVQYLLYALLKIDFDDVRPEEWTPSYAGGSSRMDFLLKKERIVLEAKITREDHKDKEIGNELVQDIARYKQNPDCSTLICLAYDPEQHIQNPAGLKFDLENNSTSAFTVIVYICQG